MTKTEFRQLPIEAPLRPDRIEPADFDNFEIITQSNIGTILDDISAGAKEPLNHVALPYSDYLTMADWMARVGAFLEKAAEYFDQVEEMADRSREAPPDPE